MPTVMSTDMKAIERLMVVFTWIAAPVCGVVLGVALYTFLNRHSGDTPPPDGPATRTNGPVVLGWSVVTSVLALVAVIYGITELNSASIATAKNVEDSMVVNVVGNQWVWSFEYPELGVQSHELMLPINRPVAFHVTSVDVNHSFWPVQLGVKVDANKLAETLADTTPTKLGEFDVKCAELCGLYHAYMETTGEVMTKADFDNWVIAQGGHTA
jgi:cytochrome c oxidase subunit 2